MVRKTRKDKKTKKTRKINTRKRQRRGGKKPGNWKIGYWSEEPMIHAKFMTENGNKKECGYSILYGFNHLEEDDRVPLEPLEDGKKIQHKKTELLQILTDSKTTDMRNKTKKETKEKNREYRDCTLKKKQVLDLLEDNPVFQQKVADGKVQIEEMVEMDRKQQEMINQLFTNQKDSSNAEGQYIIGKNKELYL